MGSRVIKLLIILSFLFVSCYDDCPRIWGKNITNYKYNPHDTTPNGYKIDSNGQDIDLADIDCIIEATDKCFISLDVDEFETPDPECLKIIIASDWFHPIDKETGEEIKDVQIFPCDLPGAQGCAGIIQNNQIIIVPPSLDALSHELTHVQTGRSDPYPDDWRKCSDGIRKENCREIIEEFK